MKLCIIRLGAAAIAGLHIVTVHRAGCQALPRAQQSRGDTSVVLTRGPGTWGEVGDPVELVRIGTENGSIQFGEVRSIVALRDRGVIAFDGQTDRGASLLRFDSLGHLIATIGREGSGPGEFRRNAGPLVVDNAQVLFVRDWGQARIDRFRVDGTPMAAIVSPLITTSLTHEVFVGPSGSSYVRERRQRGDPEGLLHFNTKGQLVETIEAPHLWYSTRRTQPFNPTNWWAVLPDGRQVAVRSDRAGFLVWSYAKAKRYVWAEIPARAPKYLSAERGELQAYMDWLKTNDPGDADPSNTKVPADKQVSAGFIIDGEGRVWIRRTSIGVRISAKDPPRGPREPPHITYSEPLVYDGFLSTGTFLGEVRFPPNVSQVSFVDNMAWAVVTDLDGVESIVRFRLTRPGR